ncbi:bifunctional folylpolyglutamate synthase/dihydrofolate synthase [Nitratiruptor sp. SB155-2]|uniref:bifunctional folylpolyglutamate synthase/dihydrofolate synthase n=1 Tax=Nitratiruptor sp. (strain SB155-2) TaxID=387092 RepID=UPI00015870C8|nr:bifunctional folylpolyglutamate synthase/dihydrofolate synthase [Nitratiruptor sp. SB155-2]BAF70569.1 folylpolyglutamate synthase [Nitratiruptor sp. SB155-2]
MSVHTFLNQKPLYYTKFDPSRMQRVYEYLQGSLHLPPIIHIIGTNGKGTTGRFLAGMLKESGKKVGHYTSPHILHFHERIWIDGKFISDETLESVHQKVQSLIPKKMARELSYFEYTTLLAAFAFEECDYVVMEAGLGGEYDATSVFENCLTLVTPIDYDHQAFLGDTIQSIAATKLKAVQEEAIFAKQLHDEVYQTADELGIRYRRVENLADEEACQKACENIPSFFSQNLMLAQAAAKFLGFDPDVQKAVSYRMPGRFEKRGNIILDVGHNPLSARAILQALDKKVVLVYNSFEDKEYEKILSILQPKIESVEIVPMEHPRLIDQKRLKQSLEELSIPYCEFTGFDEDKEYLVYGSFSVIEEIYRKWLPDSMNI